MPLPETPPITREAFRQVCALRPRRFCFASGHEEALKKAPGQQRYGRFRLPFYGAAGLLFESMTSLQLKPDSFNEGAFWFPCDDENQYKTVEAWKDRVHDYVFMRDLFSLSLCLSFERKNEDEYTPIGDLFYKIKYTGQHGLIDELAGIAAEAVRNLPFYEKVGLICAVPPKPGKSWDLPSALVQRISALNGLENLTRNLRWVKRPVRDLKGLESEDKWPILQEAGLVYNGRLEGQSVLVLDDMYETGTTMNFTAGSLQAGGAGSLLGLSIVKAWRN